MIELHRTDESIQADEIENKFKELVIAHKVKYHTEDRDDYDATLPFIKENDAIYSGPEEIDNFIRELSGELHQMRIYTSDSCYIDPDTGNTC